METAGVSGTVNISDQRSYIKFETLREKNPTEIHGGLSEVCGEFPVPQFWLDNRFHSSSVSIDNDPRPGRPRTSTDGTNVKLVADVLEEDRRKTCEELSRATGVPATSVFRILTNDLKKRKISARWALLLDC